MENSEYNNLIICPECGTANLPNAKFCCKCGYKLARVSSSDISGGQENTQSGKKISFLPGIIAVIICAAATFSIILIAGNSSLYHSDSDDQEVSASVSSNNMQVLDVNSLVPDFTWIVEPELIYDDVIPVRDMYNSPAQPHEHLLEYKTVYQSQAIAYKGDKTEVLSGDGKVLIPSDYNIEWSSEFGYYSSSKNTLYSFDGKEIYAESGENTSPSYLWCDDEQALYRYDGDVSLSENLQEVSSLPYPSPVRFTQSFDNIDMSDASFAKAEYIVIGIDAMPISSQIYTDIQSFSEGLAAAEKDGLWGYIDSTGNTVIEFEYSRAGSFYSGIAAAEKNGTAGYIDKSGKEVIPFKFDAARSVQDGSAWVKYEGKWGIVKIPVSGYSKTGWENAYIDLLKEKCSEDENGFVRYFLYSDSTDDPSPWLFIRDDSGYSVYSCSSSGTIAQAGDIPLSSSYVVYNGAEELFKYNEHLFKTPDSNKPVLYEFSYPDYENISREIFSEIELSTSEVKKDSSFLECDYDLYYFYHNGEYIEEDEYTKISGNYKSPNYMLNDYFAAKDALDTLTAENLHTRIYNAGRVYESYDNTNEKEQV